MLSHWWAYDDRYTYCGLPVARAQFGAVPTCPACRQKIREAASDVAALENSTPIPTSSAASVRRPAAATGEDRRTLECPYCGRVMSVRESLEQHACNDCV